MEGWKNIVRLVRRCHSRVWDRQFLTFLFFLALSAVFWLLYSLNDTYERTFSVQLELTGKPQGVRITQPLPEEVSVVLRDKGFNLLRYSFGSKLKPISVAHQDGRNGHVHLPSGEIRRQLEAQLPATTTIVRIRPENADYFYNYGQHKTVPVVADNVQLSTAPGYTLLGQSLSRSRVTIYAWPSTLDTIQAVYTRPVFINNLKDSLRTTVRFQPIAGVEFSPGVIELHAKADELTEKRLSVKVQGVNFPAGRVLRTFPTAVTVNCKTAISYYDRIVSDDFVIVVNYEQLLRAKSNRVQLRLGTLPVGVTDATITPQEVEFLIENVVGNEDD